MLLRPSSFSFGTPALLAAALAWASCPAGLQAQDSPTAPATPAPAGESDAVALMKENPYWIGVDARPIPDELAQHLGIEGGVLVVQMVPEGAAAKAGLRNNDVILAVGEHPLTSVVSLMEAINAEAPDEMPFTVIRRGERLTIQVAPERRPDSHFAIDSPLPIDVGAMPPGFPHPLQFDVRRFGPGFAFGVATPADAPEFPEGMTLHYHKRGRESGTITVEIDGERWEVSENDLDKLPDNVRPHVERALRLGPFQALANVLMQAPGVAGQPQALPPSDAPMYVTPMPPGAAIEQQRFAEAARQLAEQRQMLEEYRRQLDTVRDEQRRQVEELRQLLERALESRRNDER